MSAQYQPVQDDAGLWCAIPMAQIRRMRRTAQSCYPFDKIDKPGTCKTWADCYRISGQHLYFYYNVGRDTYTVVEGRKP